MELKCIVAAVFRNFEFELGYDGELETREGFLRKPVGVRVGIKQRN